jgi:hypothetical protein
MNQNDFQQRSAYANPPPGQVNGYQSPPPQNYAAYQQQQQPQMSGAPQNYGVQTPAPSQSLSQSIGLQGQQPPPGHDLVRA